MQTFTELKLTYPLLVSRLTYWAAERIAGTSTHLESEARYRIAQLEWNMHTQRLESDVFKEHYQDGMLVNQVDPILLNTKDEFKSIAVDLAAAKFSLMGIKHNDVTPSQQDFAIAEQQVSDYLVALQSPNLDDFLKWDNTISRREKDQIRRVRKFLRNPDGTRNKQIDDVVDKGWYADGGYSVLSEPNIYSVFDRKDRDRLIGYITKNSYGVACLNSLDVMFLDIDLEHDISVSWRSHPWGRKPQEQTDNAEIFAAVQSVVKRYDLTFDIYRTAAGYRLLELSRTWNPTSKETARVAEEVGTDRLYQHLCETQGCFRARLEIKPWRYGDTVAHYCGRIGKSPVSAIARQIKSVHDSRCVGSKSLELA